MRTWAAFGCVVAMVAVACASGSSAKRDDPPQSTADAADAGATATALANDGGPLMDGPQAPAAADQDLTAAEADGGAAEQPRAQGAACSQAAQCQSGVCEGMGCGQDEAHCAPAQRMCTRDLRPYCGCDGNTFRTSGSCPGRPFLHRGVCP